LPHRASRRNPTAAATVRQHGADQAKLSARTRERASACSGSRPALPARRGPVDRPDRRAAWPFTGDDQGVLLRPDGGEGAGRQGPIRRGVPRLRRVHVAAQRQGRRLPVLQALPPRGRSRLAGRKSLVLEAMREWHGRYGRLPSSYDWSRTHARRRAGQALERLALGAWPSASVVTSLFGTWAAARAAALWHDVGDL
jgi:hypothetical protein